MCLSANIMQPLTWLTYDRSFLKDSIKYRRQSEAFVDFRAPKDVCYSCFKQQDSAVRWKIVLICKFTGNVKAIENLPCYRLLVLHCFTPPMVSMDGFHHDTFSFSKENLDEGESTMIIHVHPKSTRNFNIPLSIQYLAQSAFCHFACSANLPLQSWLIENDECGSKWFKSKPAIRIAIANNFQVHMNHDDN